MRTRIQNAMYFIVSALILTSFMSFKLQDPKWSIPNEYKNMKNPLKKTAENMTLGKQLYTRHCASCHGESGNGDGEKVKQLVNKSLRPANFKLNEFQVESDGVHFYKIKFGREGLHSFKGKLADEDIWGIVLQISTFK